MYKPARHTDLICRKLEEVERGKCKRLIITLPPRHSKSMTVSETFPSWFIGKNPNRQVIQVSYGEVLARKFGKENKNKISEFGEDLFGISLDPSNHSVTNWGIAGYRGQMLSTGTGGSITGQGANLLVIDDPIRNRTDSLSPTYKEKLWSEWQNTLLTRLQPDGAVIIILTRWSEDDLVGRILEESPDEWDVISLPAIAEDENDLLGRKIGDPLWPEIGYDKEWAEQKKKEVGSITWASLYQQRPSPNEGSIIKRNWIKYYNELPHDLTETIISVDCSFKDLESSDYVVAQVWARKGADRYLVDQVRDRMGITATMDAIRNLVYRYPEASTKLVEDKANGTAVIEMLKREISGIIPVTPKESKESRMFAVSPSFEAGNVYFPSPKLAPWVHDLVEEIVTFPAAKHDDQCDSMTQALNRWQQTPMLWIGRA